MMAIISLAITNGINKLEKQGYIEVINWQKKLWKIQDSLQEVHLWLGLELLKLVKKMLTKEECVEALDRIVQEFGCDPAYYGLNMEYTTLLALIDEHFKLVEENERLSTQLVECQRVCQVKQERINELAKGTVSYVD